MRIQTGVIAAFLLVMGLAQTPTAAFAQIDLISRETISGYADLRLNAATGEKSWVNGGYGKTSADGGGGGFKAGGGLAEADIVWKPELGWNLSATVTGQYEPGQIKPFGVGEAYLTYKPAPTSPLHEQIRVGMFYPPISQEHSGATWMVTDSITPSAINSWIGEEVKVVGAEIAFDRSFENGQELGATLGVFGGNDTSGTLLSMRGWALHDLKSTYGGDFTLPPLTNFMKFKQARITTPVMDDIDRRAGFYGRVDWRPAGNVALNAFYYDNLGNLTGKVGLVPAELQWAWGTKFWNLGANIKLDDRTRIKSQALKGETYMGYATPQIWIDVDYQSAYLMISRSYGASMLSSRFDYFETTDNTWKSVDNNAEHGSALMAAWRQPINPNVSWLVEAQQVWSTRADRRRLGEAPSQDQTVLSSSLRLSF